MSNQEIKKGDTVKILSTGKYGIIMSIQDVHNRYQLKGVSGWQYPINDLEKQNFESLLTLIDQQAEKIANFELLEERNRHLQGMFNNQNKLAQLYYEEKEATKASLELAVKALEWYADDKNQRNQRMYAGYESEVMKDAGKLAVSTLDQIRRK